MKQLTNHILMIRPAQFRMNEQTAVNNYFQASAGLSPEEVVKKSQEEFDAYVSVLKEKGVQVTVVQDTEDPEQKPPTTRTLSRSIRVLQHGITN